MLTGLCLRKTHLLPEGKVGGGQEWRKKHRPLWGQVVVAWARMGTGRSY